MNDKIYRIKLILLIFGLIFNLSKSLSQEKINWRSQHDTIKGTENKINYLILTARKEILNNDTALLMHNIALSLTTSINNEVLKGKCLRSIGSIYLNRNEHQKMIECYQQALTIAQKQNDSMAIGESYNGLGVAMMNLKNYENSIAYYLKALKFLNNTSDIYRITIRNIGNIYRDWKKYDIALKYFFQSLSLCEKFAKNNADSLYIGYNYQSIGSTYTYMNKEDSGLIYKELSLDIFKKLHYERGIIETSLNLAISLKNLNRYKESENIFNSILQNKDIQNNHFMKSIVYINLASLYSKQSNYLDAAKTAEKGYNLLKENKLDIEAQIAACQTISRNYYLAGKYKDGMDYCFIMFELKDSLYNLKTFETMSKLESEFQSEKKEKEILQLKQENSEKEKKAFQQKVVIGGLILLFIVSAGFVYLIQNRRKIKRAKEKAELDQELTLLEQKALKMQINTHFIFNAIDVAQGYISENDYQSAKKYLSEVAHLIRLILENASDSQVSLEREIDFLKSYMEVCKTLYDNKFQYEIHLNNIVNADDIEIPAMLLQPFIENAILHGAIPNSQKTNIKLNFAIENEILTCSIEDDGVGRDSGSKSADQFKRSMGLQVTSERLKKYNDPFNIDSNIKTTDLIKNNLPAGTLVELKIHAFQNN